MADSTDAGVVLLVLGILAMFGTAFGGAGCCVLGFLLLIVGVVLIATDQSRRRPQVGPLYPGHYAYMPPPMVPPRRVPFCPNCGTAADWVPQYARWWCGRCRQYLWGQLPPPWQYQ